MWIRIRTVKFSFTCYLFSSVWIQKLSVALMVSAGPPGPNQQPILMTSKPVLWIRMDPHGYGFPGSGSVWGMRIRIQEQVNWPNLQINFDFQEFYKGLCTYRYLVPNMIYDQRYIFHLNFTWRKSLTWIWTRIRAGLTPHRGSGSWFALI